MATPRIRWQDINWTGEEEELQPEEEFPNANPSAFNAQTAELEGQDPIDSIVEQVLSGSAQISPPLISGSAQQVPPALYGSAEQTPPALRGTTALNLPPPPQGAGFPGLGDMRTPQMRLPQFSLPGGALPEMGQAVAAAVLQPIANTFGVTPTTLKFGAGMADAALGGVGDAASWMSRQLGGSAPLDTISGIAGKLQKMVAKPDPVVAQARAITKWMENKQQNPRGKAGYEVSGNLKTTPMTEVMNTDALTAPPPAPAWEPDMTGSNYKPMEGASGGGYAEWRDKSGKLIRKRVDQFGEGLDAQHVWTTKTEGDEDLDVENQTGPWLQGQSRDQWKSAELSRKSNAAFGDIMNVLGLETAKNQLAQARASAKSIEMLSRMSPQEQLELQFTRSLWEKDPQFAVIMRQLEQLDAAYETEKQKIAARPGTAEEKIKAKQELEKWMKEKREGLQGMVMKKWAPESMMFGGGR